MRGIRACFVIGGDVTNCRVLGIRHVRPDVTITKITCGRP